MADKGAHGVIVLQKTFISNYSDLWPIDTVLVLGNILLPVGQAIPQGVLTGRYSSAKYGACGPFIAPFASGPTELGESDKVQLTNIPDVGGSLICGGEQLQVGMGMANGEGSPEPLVIARAGQYRFRVGLTGSSPQSISIWVKQVSNTSPRPQMIVRKNLAVGVTDDITVTAGSSTDWIEMVASVPFTTLPGAVWVELHNKQLNSNPAYFGRLTGHT